MKTRGNVQPGRWIEKRAPLLSRNNVIGESLSSIMTTHRDTILVPALLGELKDLAAAWA